MIDVYCNLLLLEGSERRNIPFPSRASPICVDINETFIIFGTSDGYIEQWNYVTPHPQKISSFQYLINEKLYRPVSVAIVNDGLLTSSTKGDLSRWMFSLDNPQKYMKKIITTTDLRRFHLPVQPNRYQKSSSGKKGASYLQPNPIIVCLLDDRSNSGDAKILGGKVVASFGKQHTVSF